MANFYIYIDESGDPGVKIGSSSDFVVAAVVVADEYNKNNLEKALLAYRKGLGWSDDRELKFHQSGKDSIRLAFRAVQNYEYTAYAMILNKHKIISGELSIPEQNLTALYVIHELLKRLSLNDAIITIDGAYGRKYITKARTYLRQQLKISGLSYSAIRFVDSKKSSLIQLADLVAGSVAKSISSDSQDLEFVKILGDKLRGVYRL